MASSPNDYVTASEVIAAMPSQGMDSQESLIETLITRVCRMIDSYCGVDPGSFKVTTDEVRHFSGSGQKRMSIAMIATDPTTVSIGDGDGVTYPDNYEDLTINDYVLWPYNALQNGEPFTTIILTAWGQYSYWPEGVKRVRVEGKFGFSENPPDDIVQAAIIQVGRMVKRGLQSFEDTGANEDLGQMTYTQNIDPDLKLILNPYKRTAI